MRAQRFAAEALGTGLLLATVIGSGIMGERLAGGNVALALLGNTLATGAMLVVLITMLGPISGAHFNPAVTRRVRAREGDCARRGGWPTCWRRSRAALPACWSRTACSMRPCSSSRPRCAPALRNGCRRRSRRSGLCSTILLTLRANPAAVATSVGLYITAAYWFTASTSFANPAVTIARALSDTFAGIRPADVARSSLRSCSARWLECSSAAGLPLDARTSVSGLLVVPW